MLLQHKSFSSFSFPTAIIKKYISGLALVSNVRIFFSHIQTPTLLIIRQIYPIHSVSHLFNRYFLRSSPLRRLFCESTEGSTWSWRKEGMRTDPAEAHEPDRVATRVGSPRSCLIRDGFPSQATKIFIMNPLFLEVSEWLSVPSPWMTKRRLQPGMCSREHLTIEN